MALRYKLHIDAGTDFEREFEYTNPDGSVFDLTGYAALMHIRETASDPLTLEIVPELDLANGIIRFALTAEQTSTLTAAKYVYAIELTSPDGTVQRFVEGGIAVSPEVVR